MVTSAVSRTPFVARGSRGRALLADAFASAGIKIDGPDPWDLQVLDDRFYERVIEQGTLGLGESYMDGWWECAAIDQMTERALSRGLKERPTGLQMRLAKLRLRLFNLQSLRASRQVADVHYDLR